MTQIKVVHVPESTDFEGPSIFLAGPTPRSKDVPSWRPEAIKMLYDLNFMGAVFVPERENYGAVSDYDDQIEWEWNGLDECTIVAFWVPRKMGINNALTTNVEAGLMATSGKVIYGRPEWAEHVNYLDYVYLNLALKYNIAKNGLDKYAKPLTTLKETMAAAVEGAFALYALRRRGEKGLVFSSSNPS